jgi:eukaryotic-like serine/threonine-protein kinase
VKILDFGLVQETGNARLTQSGTVLGTPAYMSPEQANGDPCDARSDLFSLGVILYRLCSGQLPVEGKSAIAILLSMANNKVKSLQEVRPDLPHALTALVMRLLAPKPEDRLPNAETVSATLRSLLSQMSTAQTPATSPKP